MQYILLHVRYRWGGKPPALGAHEFSVVTLVRNGDDYIDEFLDYYKALGAKHIFIIDNNSTDGTVAKAKRYSDVSIFSTTLAFTKNENQIRRFFLKRHFKNSWALCVDIDEFFDFPGSGAMSLATFIQYLERESYTAVAACMLDMFAANDGSEESQCQIRDIYVYTDIVDIRKDPYPHNWLTLNNVVPDGLPVFSGGVRQKMLDADHELSLTKHPLLFIDKDIIPFTNPHFCAHAKLADVQCVLLHYKFIKNFLQRAEAIANDPEVNPVWAKENASYVRYFSNTKARLSDPSAYKYVSADDLVDKSLLFMTDKYRRYRRGSKPSK